MPNLSCFSLTAVTVVLLGVFSFPAFAADHTVNEPTVANSVDSVRETTETGVTELPVSPPPKHYSLLADSTSSDVAKAATSQGVSSSQYLNLFLGLVVIIGFIFLVAWLLRRVGGVSTASAGAMQIVGGISLGSRDRVVLLQVGEKQILIGASPGNISMLHAFDEPAIEVENASSGSDFYRKLQASLNRNSNQHSDQEGSS